MTCLEVTFLIIISWISVIIIKDTYFSNEKISFDDNPVIGKIEYKKNIICNSIIIIQTNNDTFSKNDNGHCYEVTKDLQLDSHLYKKSKSLKYYPFIYFSIGYFNKTFSFYLVNYNEFNCTLNQFTQILRDNSVISYESFFASDLLYTFDDNYKSILRYDILENSILLKSRKIISISQLTIKNREEIEFETKMRISC